MNQPRVLARFHDAEKRFKQCVEELEEDRKSGPVRYANDEPEADGGGRKVGALEMAAAMAQVSMIKMGCDPLRLPSIDALLHRGMDTVPVAETKITSVCGWLLPTGKFYGCGMFEHIGVATNLLEGQYPDAAAQKGGYEHLAEKLGWIKITGTGRANGTKKPTQRQLDKLHEYAEYHGKSFDEITAHLPS